MKYIERLIFQTRWLLLPMYLGLVIALVAYGYKFAIQIYLLLRHINSLNDELMVSVLGLVDAVMVGNLIVMIIQGSYAIFIQKFDLPEAGKPQWLDHINAGTLKVKMATSLVGISSIHLLTDFISAPDISWQIIFKHSIIHALFIVSTIGLALGDRIIHPHQTH